MEILTGGVRLDRFVSKLTFQFAGLLGNASMSRDTAIKSAIEIIALWLTQKKLVDNPSIAGRVGVGMTTFSVDEGNISVDIINLLTEPSKKWAMRFKQPDTQVAARTWVTQVVIEDAGESAQIYRCNMKSSHISVA